MQCMSTVAVVRRETGGWKWGDHPVRLYDRVGIRVRVRRVSDLVVKVADGLEHPPHQAALAPVRMLPDGMIRTWSEEKTRPVLPSRFLARQKE